MSKKIKLMSHLIAGYPTDELTLTIARALVEGGSSILEIQLPFSDPSADGPAIQTACNDVLRQGYSTEKGLSTISKIHDLFPNVTIYLMSYGSLIYTPGVSNFCKKASSVGIKGLIIPDLPFDCDEGLSQYCKDNNMENIPVAAPSMAKDRLYKLAHAGFNHIYASLRVGITGSKTIINTDTIDFLKNIASGGSHIFGGFGISTQEQASKLASSVDSIVAGSVFVRLISEYFSDPKQLSKLIKLKVQELTNYNGVIESD